MKQTNVIIKPLLTEKATQAAQKKIYTFEVYRLANKNMVRQAVEEMYKVKVKDIHMHIRKGKEKRVGRKSMTKTYPKRKIAVISVKEGTISIFPQL